MKRHQTSPLNRLACLYAAEGYWMAVLANRANAAGVIPPAMGART